MKVVVEISACVDLLIVQQFQPSVWKRKIIFHLVSVADVVTFVIAVVVVVIAGAIMMIVNGDDNASPLHQSDQQTNENHFLSILPHFPPLS